MPNGTYRTHTQHAQIVAICIYIYCCIEGNNLFTGGLYMHINYKSVTKYTHTNTILIRNIPVTQGLNIIFNK